MFNCTKNELKIDEIGLQEIYTPLTGAAGILLHRSGHFIIRKAEIISFVVKDGS